MTSDAITILRDTPVSSIEDAIAVMTAIDASLPDDDGVKWFNRLYLRVTVSVGAAVADAGWIAWSAWRDARCYDPVSCG